MGPLTFNSQSYPQLKQTRSFSLLPPSSSPAYSLSQNLKPKLMPSHGWLTLTWDAGWPYAAGYAAYPATYGLGYNGYATGYAGAHLIGKREADSEAKPWLTYGYAGYPYAATYGAYAYPSVYNTAYAAPVATYAGAHLIGKREAEADSEAK